MYSPNMRKPFVAANWKMFTSAASARQLARDVVKGWGSEDRVQVALCPPFPYLLTVAEELRGSVICLGAQNCYVKDEGAFTGEVSPAMLRDVGCKYVILGHSERRHVLGETDAFINQKVHAALAAGLDVIFCVGETLDQRERGQVEEVLDGQLSAGLRGAAEASMARVVVAYEPVWAIGTGKNASPEQAQTVHTFLRDRITHMFSPRVAQALVIQYGGSVKPENLASLIAQPDVDGGLVGGASLKADLFLAICREVLTSGN